MQNKVSAEVWLSFYIYTKGDLNLFLKSKLSLLISSIRQKELFTKFFYIRYYDSGQHIRLRFLSKNSKCSAMILSLVDEWDVKLRIGNAKIESGYTHYKIVDYLPEIDRYGGTLGVQFCESFFFKSSEIILKYLGEHFDNDYETIMAFAIKLHFSLASLITADSVKSKNIFNEIFLDWLQPAHNYFERYYGKPGNYTREIFSTYESSFVSQREVFSEIIIDTMQCINSHQFQEEWMGPWREAVLLLKDELFGLDGLNDFDTYKPILKSLIHMTNNRLGISNMEESFLGYVICESMNFVNISQDATIR